MKPKSNPWIHSIAVAKAVLSYMFNPVIISLNNYIINVRRQEDALQTILGIRKIEINRQ